ncbi:hypothetical protein GQ53DRAFT_748717 [Thozetella sp. PMI_491]|nr:hypothetical protein GQ53DRAFT_748717 [Thozetella sp. PMI_491]
MGKLPSASFLRQRGHAALGPTYNSAATCAFTRPTAIPSSCLPPTSPCGTTQVRHATYVMRSRRPYQFTQLVQLSDGSTYTMRTTSPASLLKSTKDTRNHVMWQPSEKSLRNVELDEAGKLAAFRERFGRGWDLEEKPVEGSVEEAAGAAPGKGAKGKPAKAAEAAPAAPAIDAFDSLADLISGYAAKETSISGGGLSAKEQAKKDKKKK